MRVSRIARWDGSAWYSMGAMNDVVQRIRISGTNAYIGGLFTQADDYIVNHLTVWDGTRFQALGRAGRSEGAVSDAVVLGRELGERLRQGAGSEFGFD